MQNEALFILTIAFLCIGGVLLLHIIFFRFCKSIHERTTDWLSNLCCAATQTGDRLPLYDELSIHEESPLSEDPPSYEEAIRVMEKLLVTQKELMSSLQSLVNSDEYKLKCSDSHARLNDVTVIP